MIVVGLLAYWKPAHWKLWAVVAAITAAILAVLAGDGRRR